MRGSFPWAHSVFSFTTTCISAKPYFMATWKTPEALSFSPSLAGESLPVHPPECWGCGVKEGLWQQGLGHGSERTAWGGEGKELWKLSAAQSCGDVCTQRCQCHHGTFSWGAPSHPQHFTTGKIFFKLWFSSKSSFPEHQTPQTILFFLSYTHKYCRKKNVQQHCVTFCKTSTESGWRKKMEWLTKPPPLPALYRSQLGCP